MGEDSTVRDIGQLIKRGDISLVSRRGGAGYLVRDLVSTAPLLQDTVGLL